MPCPFSQVIAVDCGIKNNIIRKLVECDITLKVVPWNYDFTAEDFDGISQYPLYCDCDRVAFAVC